MKRPARTCHDCGNPPAHGKGRCGGCLLLHQARQRARRGDRRSELRCPECGLPCEPSYAYCALHAAKHADSARRRRTCSACYTAHPVGACSLTEDGRALLAKLARAKHARRLADE